MNTILRSEFPDLFENIDEFFTGTSKFEHRRGSTFYKQSIATFNPEYEQFFPSYTDFDRFVGTWETNQYISSEDDTDYREINKLTRVVKVTKQVTVTSWEPVQNEI